MMGRKNIDTAGQLIVISWWGGGVGGGGGWPVKQILPKAFLSTASFNFGGRKRKYGKKAQCANLGSSRGVESLNFGKFPEDNYLTPCKVRKAYQRAH